MLYYNKIYNIMSELFEKCVVVYPLHIINHIKRLKRSSIDCDVIVKPYDCSYDDPTTEMYSISSPSKCVLIDGYRLCDSLHDGQPCLCWSNRRSVITMNKLQSMLFKLERIVKMKRNKLS
jgi:hypothetical protein